MFFCPECKWACKAHDLQRFTWQHLDFFSTTASSRRERRGSVAPITALSGGGVVGTAGQEVQLLFEQAALILVREMPVLAAAPAPAHPQIHLKRRRAIKNQVPPEPDDDFKVT